MKEIYQMKKDELYSHMGTGIDGLSKEQAAKILEEKDYIAHSKPSGYRSYHLVIEQEYEGQKSLHISSDTAIIDDSMWFECFG